MATPTAAAAEESAEYESDPEDAPLPSMRRREASDDEDGEAEDSPPPARKDSRYDGDLDGEGGAPAYYDDDGKEEFDDEEEDESEVDEEELEVAVLLREDGGGGEGSAAAEAHAAEPGRDARMSGGERIAYEGEEHVEEVLKEEKKENEPYAVPTVGAFYMHDDRFGENGRGRHRRMLGGRKLWESKDDHAWVHDRFEEMNLLDSLHDQARRTSRGRFRGRGIGKSRGIDRGFGRGNKNRAYFDNGNNQIHAPKSVRGRGPRRYVPAQKNNSEVPETQQKQSTRPQELVPNNTLRRQPQESNSQPDRALPRKHVFASSLNSASPPFYPSGASSQEISVTHKREIPLGSTNNTTSSSLQMEDNFQATQSGSFLKGKAIVNSIGHDRLYISTSLPQFVGKPSGNPSLSSGSSISSPNTTQSYSSGVHGKGISNTGPPSYQQMPSPNQVARVPSQINPSLIQQRPVQSTLQSVIQASTQQLGQRPGGGNQVLTLSPLSSTNSFEVGEMDSLSGSSNSKSQIIERGKTSNQGSGKGTLIYNGTQVIGAAGSMGLPLGEHGFPGTPALLPVMQFNGQHPGGPGVPAVGMALPGYVTQSQLGFGNNEMTWCSCRRWTSSTDRRMVNAWLSVGSPRRRSERASPPPPSASARLSAHFLTKRMPVLAGAAGALGASYGSPYIALDRSYYAHSSAQTSSSLSSRENTSTKPTRGTPPQTPETVNNEYGQRHNKPRRYSEMNFGQ